MSGQGRGRGEANPGSSQGEYLASLRGARVPRSGDGEETIRGRGGFRSSEIHTIPDNIKSVKGDVLPTHQKMVVVANYFKVTPMKDRFVFQYRVDFEPNIESEPIRRKVFKQVTESTFARKVIFDGAFDARSGHKTRDEVTTFTTSHPDSGTIITVTVKRVGFITGGFEMTRVYNMNMKMFLKVLGFYQVSKTGAYVHPDLATSVGTDAEIMVVRGYRTSANVHETGQILMNLEPVSKVVQRKNVLEIMADIRNQARSNFKEAIRAALTGKLCVTAYKKIVYRIEDVNFDLNPTSTFPDRDTNQPISYVQYYQDKYDKRIAVTEQPLLLVIQNNRRQADRTEDSKDIYLVPELCNIAGLTDAQRMDNRLKTEMIKAAQIDPNIRVEHMNTFLRQLKDNQSVQESLSRWGYQYDERPVQINARILATEQVAMGKSLQLAQEQWPKVDNMASFDFLLQRNEKLAKAPVFKKLGILISRTDANLEGLIKKRLKDGFDKIELNAEAVETCVIGEGDGAHLYVQYLKRVPQDTTAVIVILPRQNKERYDAIKKFASVERGLITQVVTSRLMTDERKAGGASVKIAIQVAAKLGGEPWYVRLPPLNAMICGYDTYHDTANRGRSFGAFVASMNDRFSRWYSKTDCHDRLDELSAHMGNNLIAALKRYHELNKKFPERIFIYRDGVGDGQLEHVFNVELKNIKKVVKDVTKTGRLTFIVVNKRVGARFYMCNNNRYINPPPGSVIDDVVTRKERYDFYLISQSTRFGTVSPTYYNIIHDESTLDAAKHQILAYKMCFLYYNWTGSVMVPAPCQYAHKLALLCGEHLHAAPNAVLDDRERREMHLIFERSKGRFKSNCNILALAWMPYYDETKFRQALFEYHQRQLINLTSSIASNNVPVDSSRSHASVSRSQLANHNNQRPSQCNNTPNNSQNNRTTNNETATTSSNRTEHTELQPVQFLNSRIAELHQRYVYLRESVPNNGPPITKSPSELNISNELDSKYGRMPDFGWLVVGNVGKIVGVTLTSLVQPINEPSIQGAKLSRVSKREQDADLMIFNDSTPNQSEDRNRENLCNDNVVQVPEYDQLRPDKKSSRNNYNLRGHLDEVILVKWNELYQKLATIDSKGNVLIWCKVNEKFTIQTPFYNRTKSVADFKWSNDGKTALICYTDSFILVGSSSGQRHWHSMLNLDDYHITCASWTPNDEQLLLGVSNGNVVVIDLPHSELTELVVNQTNIRTMCWSSCDMNLKDTSRLSNSSSFEEKQRRNSNRRNSTVVNHRRLSRDCSVFSRYRFCSQGPPANIAVSRHSDSSNDQDNRFSRFKSEKEAQCNKYRNILAIDFANNTIKLFDGGLDDPEPHTIQVNQESYIVQWSGDGKVLAVAGFNIHTTAPSVGCLRCRYLNAIKFYDQEGRLIYEYAMEYTRYPITALTWAHDDKRIFLATGPKLHCAKVFADIPSLNLLAMSCFQRSTRLADKNDIIESIFQNRIKQNVLHWQSNNCPIDIIKDHLTKKKFTNHLTTPNNNRSPIFCNNINAYQYQLPFKIAARIDELFSPTIRQPYDEQWSLNDIIWQVPKNDQRYYCTLVCYTCDRDINSTGYQYRTDILDRITDNHSGEQNKIFVLYIEFQGSLIPILRARRVGFLKPEFVIFDPEDNQVRNQRQRKVSDVSQQSFLNTYVQRRLEEHNSSNYQSDLAQTMPSSSPFYYNEGFSTNCSDLHSYLEPRASGSGSLGRQSLSDAEHYYNFECDTVNRQNQDRLAELVSGRSHHQEPIALPMSSNPYLLYMMAMSTGHQQVQNRQHINGSPFQNLLSLQSGAKRAKGQSKLKSTGLSSSLTENNELIRIKSNIWGTKFKLINVGNRMVKHRSILGSVIYKASILHLQPRQIFLTIKDMSNYCCLCSKHHHTKAQSNKSNFSHSSPCKNGINQKQSLLDMPNNEAPLITPLKSIRKSRAKKSIRQEGDKVVLPLSDGIRVVPKLDWNQEYRYAGGSVMDQNKPSTSRGKQTKLVESSNSTCRKSPLTLSSPSKAGQSLAQNSQSSSRTKRKPNLELSKRSSSSSRYENHDNLSRDKHAQLKSGTSSDCNQDDVLTLSLCQGDQVKVEMSSIQAKKEEDMRVSADKTMNNFLAENKTLKSIQSITKMIVDLSSKANELDVSEENCIDANLSSPSKLVKLTNETSQYSTSTNFIPPSTPVHRPRRVAPRNVNNCSILQSQSATTTPLASVSRRHSRRREPSGIDKRTTNLLPLPPPPPPVPIRRRLSSSAKRFIDGSLRSLYSGYSTDFENDEEVEPLVNVSSASKQRELRRPFLGSSQPTTPIKSLRKQTSDITSLRVQLFHKLRGNGSKTEIPSRTTKSKLMDRFNQEIKDGRSRSKFDVTSGESELSSSSEDNDTNLDFSNSELDCDLNALQTPKKINKSGYSNSVRDLRDFDQRIRERARQYGQRVSSDRQSRHKRKSICLNSSCCCAKEFKLNNRPPVWNELSQIYQLDFGGRVTQESAKNLQIDFEGNLALQFGRIDRCTYTLDYKYPFNAVQAMAIALASLTQRLK